MTAAEHNQTLNSQKTLHSSPVRVSYGVSFVSILNKIDCIVMAPHSNSSLVAIVLLPEQMRTKVPETYIYQWASMSLNCGGWVIHIYVSKQDHHWFLQRLVTCLAPSHYLNQCWLISNWTYRNKLGWNLNQNAKKCKQENKWENIVVSKC